jgi:hypothetical protein
VLPGLRDGVGHLRARICRDCAGITREFCCLRCGTETGMTSRRRGSSRLCGPCSVTWTAARLLDDGTGAIAAPLKPLAQALAAAPSPAAMLEWLDQPHIRDLLTHLAAGKLALIHETLDAWPRPRTVVYLRDLLVSCGVLPAVDKQLREFGVWLDRRLEALAGHPYLRLLRQFGLWHQLPRMRAKAAAGPLRTTAAQYARSRFIQAQAFLTWTVVRPGRHVVMLACAASSAARRSEASSCSSLSCPVRRPARLARPPQTSPALPGDPPASPAPGPRPSATNWKTTNEWRDALARIAGEVEVEGPDGKPVLGSDGKPEKVSVMARDVRNKDGGPRRRRQPRLARQDPHPAVQAGRHPFRLDPEQHRGATPPTTTWPRCPASTSTRRPNSQNSRGRGTLCSGTPPALLSMGLRNTDRVNDMRDGS